MRANFHENLSREPEVKSGSDRAFGLVMAGACCVVAGLGFWTGMSRWPYWLIAAIVFASAAWLFPTVLAPLNRAWFQLGRLLHRVVNPFVMGLQFFVIVTPVGWLMRVCGKRPLALEFEQDATSYWRSRESQPGSMGKQY